MLLLIRKSWLLEIILLSTNLRLTVLGFTSSEYVLDTEYSGANFFDGWDFFTGRDPTGGFVTYYSRSSSQLAGLIDATDAGPAYMGVDYVNTLPITSSGYADGAGRPSVRISSQRSWTHGLFIGDFNHAPSGICGTWPAFWTLGPSWPASGEIDIMESVNKNPTNAVSLHTNETCVISPNSTTQTGVLSNTNCAYYPNYNVGCGVVDPRPASYGQFNSVGGGVYAMQWTSEYIRVWFFPRSSIPQDIMNKQPNPSSWGLPTANMMGNCVWDQHFQQHKIIFDTTFCGEYAGNPYVWNSTDNSCATDTGYATCDSYVANKPGVFRDAYWSVNYVRVYQLADPDTSAQEPQYIASLQPANMASSVASTTQAPTPTASLCPTYNFTTISNGGLTYEIECGFDPPGPDISPPYSNFHPRTLEDCVAGCTYWNTHNGTNLCGGVSFDSSVPICYFKKYIDAPPKYRPGFGGVRLIYYGYPQITDDPRSQEVAPVSTYTETNPTPQYYRPQIAAQTSSTSTTTSSGTGSTSIGTQVPPPLGTPTTTTTGPSIGAGTPTVSFSGNQTVPITMSTTSPQDTTTTSTTTATSMTTSMLSTSSGNDNGAIINNTLSSTSMSSSISSMASPAASSSTTVTANTNSLTSSSASSTPLDGFQLTITTSQISSIVSSDPPPPTVISNFTYVGCKGNLYNRNILTLSEDSNNMTVEHCIDRCSTSRYAALFDSQCFCVNRPLTNRELVSYEDSHCGVPCPGDLSEKCGGFAPLKQNATMPERILTLYMNVSAIDTNDTTTVTSLSTTTQTVTVVPVDHPASPSTTGSQIYNAIFTSTMTVTAIKTTWCDYCSTCPGYQAAFTTTITVPCPVAPLGNRGPYFVSTVPMMTTSRECRCGLNGALSTTTVTIPHEMKIASLTNAASRVLAEMSQDPTTTCQLTGVGGTLGDAETLEQATALAGNGAGLMNTATSAGRVAVANGSNITSSASSQSMVASQMLPMSYTGAASPMLRSWTKVVIYLLTAVMTWPMC